MGTVEQWADLSTDKFDEVIGSREQYVIEFWAEWCAPCSSFESILREVAEEFGDLFNVARVNVGVEEALAIRCGIASVPALGLVRDGELARRVFGARGRRFLRDELQAFFGV